MSSKPVAQSIVHAEGLGRVFGSGATATRALHDVSIDVHAGELVVLRGPSGAGKTTLLNLLGGLDRPTTGHVTLNGLDLGTATEAELVAVRQRELGYVFQAFALIPVLSAAENIEMPLRIVGTPVEARTARVAELLAIVGLRDHANQRPAELSGGQQQRVGIARAIANRPRLLIADEPTGQLDSGTATIIMTMLAELVHSEGLAAIVSSHDPSMVTVADRVIEIHDGELTGPHGRHRA
jgi:putative ABC transport system ATP-binding protein